MTESNPHAPSRTRHPFKSRHLQVMAREQISANFIRVTLQGADMSDFISLGHDDHFKLILPQAGYDKPLLPQLVDGRPFIDGPRPTMRDYTPLRWDTTQGTLVVDVALHASGPASDWARTSEPGSWVGIAGPRGSMVVPLNFDWYVLLGDASALPAIERRLTELPSESQALVRIHVPAPSDQRALPTQAKADIAWVSDLVASARALQLPAGTGYTWAAGEHAVMSALRPALLAAGANPKHMRIASYWKSGQAGHEHEDLAAPTPQN